MIYDPADPSHYADMSFCAGDDNAVVGTTNLTWAQALANLQDGVPNSSYIRPNSGGALLPWIYTMIVIVFHIPTVIIRVVRWELVQIWSLVFTFFTVAVYIQAYVSSQFDPAKILVWTPIILVIDAGSMLQVFFLILEAEKLRFGGRDIIIDLPDTNATGDREALVRVQRLNPIATEARLSSSLLSRLRASQNRKEETTLDSETDNSLRQTQMYKPCSKDDAIAAKRSSWKMTTFDPHYYQDRRVWIAVLALILLMAVFTLQILGLAKAISAVSRSSGPPTVQWCSTLFEPFGVAAVDGDCNVYPITQSSSGGTSVGGFGGVGSIPIRGVWQQSWLLGTVAGLAVELLAEIVDFAILLLVSNTVRWKGVKMRRPWMSIFSGMVVLLATLVCGVFYATNLPPEVTGRMMVLMETPVKASYMVNLTSEGLKGNINSWNDGLFESWKQSYFGN